MAKNDREWQKMGKKWQKVAIRRELDGS